MSVAPTVNVMRKERGFGEGYREIRNGEWSLHPNMKGKIIVE